MLKLCAKCNIEKQLQDFRKDRSNNDGYRYECKVCSRAQQNGVYAIKYGAKAIIRNRARYKERADFVSEYKLAHPCKVCGEAEIACLDFHHLDPNEKEHLVSSMMGRNMEKLVEEINKCVVLCSNCHRKVHAGILTL